MKKAESSTDDVGETPGGPGADASATTAATANAVTTPQPTSPNATSDLVSLKSLAPRYDAAQHKTYLQRLENAVTDPKNRNIALTGRYGTGKSSVLEEFAKNHKDSTLRLAISTLGPDSADASLTNRIQKELVKQLVYSASPSTLRHSRFRRITPTSAKRAVGESALGVAVLGALLGLMGWLPSVAGTGGGQAWPEQVGVWALVFVLVVATATAVRLVTVNRFFLANVSAAGASVTLSERTHTYFDEYLDVIVRFFDEESKDFVILEDLDRFNDPHIFEALRELNTLLNNTPSRLQKTAPLRFVYAMRDSLFERLGADTREEGDDAAAAETVRANRTKFFDIVIPVVPFISHRSARELLTQLLDESDIDGIDRPLVELVAQHATDMRLLLNMRNEYLVFAERLLESDKRAPGLTPSDLFALVAYKNFHLEDFEQISRRSSDLDVLYDDRRILVRSCVAQREKRKRALAGARARPRAMPPFAKRLAERLHAVGRFERDKMGVSQGFQLLFTVGSIHYDPDQAAMPEFWEAVVAAGSITLGAAPNPQTNPAQFLGTMNQEHLEGLFPEVLKGRWEERNEDAVRDEMQKLDQEIDFLRGANFRDLADAPEFTMSVDEDDVTFVQRVNKALKSDLARDLVKHGYIDRNFTLYAAQFYGDFTGVDVATFIVQAVQTNTMEIDYRFTSDGAVANLLEETSVDFTRTVSAYNVQVLDYLLGRDDARADDVVNHLVSNFGDDAREFLTAYFTSGKQRTRLAARLSRRRWRDVFTYLVTDEGVPADVRVDLVDAALVAADPDGAYDLGADVTDFVVAHYMKMSTFTAPHEDAQVRTVVTLLERAEMVLPALDIVHDQPRNALVERNLYELTAPNLRVALGITGGVNLDRVRENDTVYQYCLTNMSTFLEAVEDDDDTRYSVHAPETLAAVLSSDAAENWDKEPLEQLTAAASPDSLLPHLIDAPKWTWAALAAAKLFRASLDNLEVYRAEAGEIDESLGELLLSAGAIDTEEPETEEDDADEGSGDEGKPDKAAAAVAVLNARSFIPSPEDRVQLVRSLDLDGPLTATQIKPEQGTLFALLLKHELVPDDAATFAQLRGAGWAAVGPAMIASSGIEEFLTPELVVGIVAELFESPAAAGKVGTRVLNAFAEFLPADDRRALEAAAKFAVHSKTPLPLDQIRRVATACRDIPELTLQLVQIASPAPAAPDIVSVLEALGTPYSHLLTRVETEFEVPGDDDHKAVFKMLQVAGQCRVSKKPRKPFFVVKLQ